MQIKSIKNKNIKDKICKTIIVLGNSGVGKTNILQRYTKKKFEDTYLETIGIMELIKVSTFTIKKLIQDKVLYY